MQEEEKGDNYYPTSAKSKQIIKEKLEQILNKMNIEHPLCEFAEDLEFETKGRFTFLELKEIIDNKFPKLSNEEKIFLLKYIPLTSLGVDNKTPYVTLLNLFSYFEKILEERIISPSLIFYKTANIIKYKFRTTTLEFIYSIGFYSSSVINLNEFYIKLASKLQLDEITCMMIFKGLDYKNAGKIKIIDFVLVIDSFRDNSNDNRYLYPQNMREEEKNAKILKLFLDKNSISLDKLFQDGQAEFMNYNDIKSNIMKEIDNNQINFKLKEPINEKMVDSVLMSVSRNFKIFRDDLDNFMQSTKIESFQNYIKLNDIQKYWIKKYIKMIESINITPKMAFESSAQPKSPNLINLEDLKRQLRILLPTASVSELNNIMDAFDINGNKTIERQKYDQIIKQINIENSEDNKQNDEQMKKTINDSSTNLWNTGVKSTSYHLLPVKGNHEILSNLNKDINKNILLHRNREEDEQNNSNIKFGEEKVTGDQGVNIKNRTSSEINRNKNKNKKLNIEGEYIDRHKLIKILEDFKYHKLALPSYDFILYLSKNEIPKQKAFEITKYIDEDNDGYISMIEIINFLLKELTFRSTKLLYKYLYLKVYYDLGFPSSEEFFSRYNFSIYDVININDLSKFYTALNIQMPLIMRSYDELRKIFETPLIYKNICELIDEYKKDPIINNFGPPEDDEEKYSISVQNFDLQMKNFVYGLLDKKDSNKDDYERASRIHQKLKPIMKNCVEKMNLSQYNLFFSRPLNMEPSLALTVFQLLKTILPSGEQLLDKNDLLMFLESYSSCSDISNIQYNIQYSKNRNKEDQKVENVQRIVNTIEQNSSPIKYAFESIPFRRNGLITSSELVKYFQIFYGNSIAKTDLMIIIKYIDFNKVGYINYNQIQMFLYDFSKKNQFSIDIELKIVTVNINKKKFSSASEYFMSDKFKEIVKNYQKITKKQHAILLKELCSSNKNRTELYYYLTGISGTSTYDIRYLTDVIDGYLESDYYNKEKEESTLEYEQKDNLIKSVWDEDQAEEKLPEQSVFEKALQNITLGDDGNVFINQLIKLIPNDCQKTIVKHIDKKRLGFVPFPDFISRCRDLFGTEINLNYKLCGQYLYKRFIKSPELVQSYLLEKINEKDILTYVTHDVLYNAFMYGFVNDKFLFEDFYEIYKEKKGKYAGMLKMHSFLQFLFYNNPELKAYPNVDFIQPAKEEIVSQDNAIIEDLVKKKLITIREIIDLINVEECELKKNFTISEDYMRKMLNRYFDYSDEELNIFCNYFRYEQNGFNLKKLFLYDKETKNNLNVILNEEILPKIKEQIINSNISTYRQYRAKFFKGDYLTVNEVYSEFNKLYQLTLFHCLLIIGDEQYLSIDHFYNEYELKELFPEKEYEPILKTAINKLHKYFDEHQDKLRLFKEIDLDKNGVLSTEEFMTVLNSMEDLNLEDTQKYKLLSIADKNKDGKINSREFLAFIKNARFLSDSNSVNEMKSIFPNINKKIAIDNTKFIPRYLNNKSIVEKNLEINKKVLKEGNGFLETIIVLQEDIVNNFFNFDCIEQDFNLADSDKIGKVSYIKFNSILKKRLFTLKDSNFERIINFANKGLDPEVIDRLKNEKVIDYKNFLNNLVNYNEEGEEQKSWDIIVEKKSEDKNESEIKLGGTAVEESKVEKDEENELDQFHGEIKDENENNEEGKEDNHEAKDDNNTEKENKEGEGEDAIKTQRNEDNKELKTLNDIIVDKKEEKKEEEEKKEKEENKELKTLNDIIVDKDSDLKLLDDIIVDKKEEKKSDDDVEELGEEKKSSLIKALEDDKNEKNEENVHEEVRDINEEILEEKEKKDEEIKKYAKSIKLGNTLVEEEHFDKEEE